MKISRTDSDYLEIGPIQSQFDKRQWCVLHVHLQQYISEVNVEYNHLMTWSFSFWVISSEWNAHAVYDGKTNGLQTSVDS